MNIPWTENLVVPLISTAVFGMVVAVFWMNRGRLFRRVQQNEPSLAQEQEAISQEPVAPVAQALEDPPPGGPEAPADVEPLTLEVEMEQLETPKQEEGAEPADVEPLTPEVEMEQLETPKQDEGAQGVEPTDSLLAIFEQETVPDTEALSLAEGLEAIDVHDLLRDSRDIAKWLTGGEKPH